MKEFFASIYEWFGTLPFYSLDMGYLLQGYDITCNESFIGTPLYSIIGWSMIILTGSLYALQYHIIDSPKCNKKHHWWIFAFIIVTLNFLIAFILTYNIVSVDDYCKELNLSVSDCTGLGVSNAIWSLIFFIILSTNPFIRGFSTNCVNTTFWKP
jgi:hypothetical protein